MHSIVAKNVLPRLQTEEDLKVSLTEPNANIVDVGKIDEEVEINKEKI